MTVLNTLTTRSRPFRTMDLGVASRSCCNGELAGGAEAGVGILDLPIVRLNLGCGGRGEGGRGVGVGGSVFEEACVENVRS